MLNIVRIIIVHNEVYESYFGLLQIINGSIIHNFILFLNMLISHLFIKLSNLQTWSKSFQKKIFNEGIYQKRMDFPIYLQC